MEVTQLRGDEPMEKVLLELMKGCDLAVRFDCADPRASFTVTGWFICPRGTINTSHVEEPT